MYKKKGSLLIAIYILLIWCTNITLAQNSSPKEFRGVWIATVNNVDWPSAPGLSVEVQKNELKELIERIEKLNLNAVIFQVRPSADAFYESETEPWSYFLTGKQGASPSPSFDPLGYAIELCHSKGIELHAWFNPFRVRNLGYYKLDPLSFAAKHPQYLREYDHKLYLDPGIPQVRTHITKVIMEVVRKYNIDAIHFDDYFYPYPIPGNKYPDLKTFKQYGKNYYPNRQSDWRRNNINEFISAIHDSIKAVKPAVNLGVSPFGIWRNKSDDPDGSPGVRGTSSYDELYADVYKWLANDWIDYVIPQIYWEQGNRFGDFETMVKWWNDHSFGKPLYVGQALYKSTGADMVFTNPKEISEQIAILRKFDKVSGFALYSSSHLTKLSETALNELTNSLLPPKIETPVLAAVLNEASIQGQALPEPAQEKIVMADKKSLADSISLRYKLLIDKNLPIPEQFSVIKSPEGKDIFWEITSSIQPRQFSYTVLIFERVKGGGFQRKILISTEQKHFLIDRKSAINPARVLFAIVSTNNKGSQSSFSKLFRIRGKRIRFN